MNSLTLQLATQVNGTINLPGSKSISNRALLLAALAKGTTILTNLLNSDDVRYMLDALKKIGVYYILSHDGTYCKITGNSDAFYTIRGIELFLGNSGTVMRLLTAALCLGNNNITLACDHRMKERPIGYLVDALRQGGAKIEYLEHECYPPLRLYGGFTGGHIMLDSSISSQFITALLIIAPLVLNDTFIKIKDYLVSKPYVDITLHMMSIFGIKIENKSYRRFIIRGRQQYCSPNFYKIEGDASSASYFLAAAAIRGGTVKVTGIGQNSIQGDIHFADVMKKMGAIITWNKHYIACTKNKLNAIDIDMNNMPDTAMTVAITALFAKGTTKLRNIYNWRVKETDRLFAMATELRKIGAIIKENKDSIFITPPITFRKNVVINTYNDHRMAMCFSLVALSGISITILNPKCITKTFPNYFEQLEHISASLDSTK